MIVCIDIGGGTTRIGFSKDKTSFEKIVKFPTYDDFKFQIERIIKEITSQTSEIERISIAAAGSVDRKKGIIIKWGQKTGWWGKSVFEPLLKLYPNASLSLENDANIAALGEATFGAGKDHSLVGYVTLSSGIGGCLITDRKILSHHFGIEPAHQIVNFTETEVWSCGQKGCYEAYASGTAFKKIFGIAPEHCEDIEVWKKYAHFVAIGVANLLVLWSPEIMVIGGGVSHKFDSFIQPLREELTALLPIFQVPLIVKSSLDEAGLYGGLAYNPINSVL